MLQRGVSMMILILGCGKMGSWFAKQLSSDNEVAVYDIDKNKAKAIGSVKVLFDLPELSLFGPELVINAVSLQNTVKAFEGVVSNLSNCIISDIASIKSELPDFYKRHGFRFVSMHPMFGPTFANMESLKEESVIIIKESDEQGKQFFKKFYSSLGLRVFEYSFKEHDDMMAYSLTTPFAASLVFAACVDKTAVPGTNFARQMKNAKGVLSEDNHLLTEILFNPKSLPQLEKITARLEFLKHIIKAKDYEEAKRFFNKLRKNIE